MTHRIPRGRTAVFLVGAPRHRELDPAFVGRICRWPVRTIAGAHACPRNVVP